MAGSDQAASLTGVTGEATLLDIDPVSQVTMTEDEYRKTLAPLSGSKNIIPMRRKPEGLTANARYGFDFRLANGSRTVSWILDGDEKSGYVLYVDLTCNGDLSDDVPIRFERSAGEYSYTFRLSRLLVFPGW